MPPQLWLVTWSAKSYVRQLQDYFIFIRHIHLYMRFLKTVWKVYNCNISVFLVIFSLHHNMRLEVSVSWLFFLFGHKWAVCTSVYLAVLPINIIIIWHVFCNEMSTTLKRKLEHCRIKSIHSLVDFAIDIRAVYCQESGDMIRITTHFHSHILRSEVKGPLWKWPWQFFLAKI